jgi:Phosphopantetheine attachment site
VPLPVLPLTPNGKVDRRALPVPEAGRHGDQAFVAPRSDTEQAVAAIWRDVLQMDRIGVNDNFFDLGGHSLLMVQLRQRLADRLARPIELVDLFTHPTVSAQAAHLEPDAAEARSEGAERGSAAAARQRAALSRLGQRRRPSPAAPPPQPSPSRGEGAPVQGGEVS